MFFYTVFCILATSFVVGECHHHQQHKKRHNDYTNSTEIDCMQHRKELIISKKNSACEPRYRLIPLKPMPSYIFNPTVVPVKRCDGHCPGKTCMPIRKRMISIPVRSYGRHPDAKGMCALVEVEEHIACRCMCLQEETDCNVITQEYKAPRCACVCKDQESKKEKCEKKPGMVWDDDDCTCNCTAMNFGCTTGHIWNRDVCECTKVKVKHGRH